MFDDEKIRVIQAMPEADAIIIIWIRLLSLAGKTNDDGLVYIQRDMPYSEEMLATLFGKPVNVIRLALTTLAKFGMIDISKDGMIEITNWDKHQNVAGLERVRLQTAERVKRFRERKEQKKIVENEKCNVTRNVSVTPRNATDIELDLDSDKERDKDKDLNHSSDKSEPHVPYQEIINYLNQKTGKKFRNTVTNQRKIKPRFEEGFTLDDFKKVIDNQVSSWKGTEWERFLRPDTLFRASKFEGYLNNAPKKKDNKSGGESESYDGIQF